MADQDPRAQLKAAIRRYPWVSRVMQWVFDLAFTPTYLITRWARAQEGHALNIGSGSRTIGDRVINLDIEDSARSRWRRITSGTDYGRPDASS